MEKVGESGDANWYYNLHVFYNTLEWRWDRKPNRDRSLGADTQYSAPPIHDDKNSFAGNISLFFLLVS